MNPSRSKALADHLESFITDERRERIHEVLRWRTRWLRVGLEDIFNPHNSSAVMRSCEIFGVQQLYTIENRNEFRRNTEIDMGASKWIELSRFNDPEGGNTEACLAHLKSEGLRVVATSLREGCVPLDELDLSTPFALLFGTEELGLSDTAHEGADEFVQIPMYGFTRSFNISVSCALALRALRERLNASDLPWRLDPADREALRLLWLRKSIGKRQQEIVADWLRGEGLPADLVPPLPKELPCEAREQKRR